MTLGTVLPRPMWKLWNAFKEGACLRDTLALSCLLVPRSGWDKVRKRVEE